MPCSYKLFGISRCLIIKKLISYFRILILRPWKGKTIWSRLNDFMLNKTGAIKCISRFLLQGGGLCFVWDRGVFSAVLSWSYWWWVVAAWRGIRRGYIWRKSHRRWVSSLRILMSSWFFHKHSADGFFQNGRFHVAIYISSYL